MVLLAGGTTAAVAAVTASPVSSGTIYGCYTNASVNGSHALVLQGRGHELPEGDDGYLLVCPGPGRTGRRGRTQRAGRTSRTHRTDRTRRPARRYDHGHGYRHDHGHGHRHGHHQPRPTTTPTLVASPVDTCASPLVLNSYAAGNTLSYNGVSVGSSYAWFQVNTETPSTITLTGSGTPAASNDVMNVYSDCAGTSLATGVTSFTGSSASTYYVEVIEGSGGTDGGFTITVDAT